MHTRTLFLSDHLKNRCLPSTGNSFSIKNPVSLLVAIAYLFYVPLISVTKAETSPRERMLFNSDWYFHKGDPDQYSALLVYDRVFSRSKARSKSDKTDEPNKIVIELKPWILPNGNAFIKDADKHYSRPEGSPGHDCPFVKLDFDDSSWEKIELPHDWAIKGPFLQGEGNGIGGGMGRLPSPGIGWYRKKFFVPAADAGKMVYLDIDGAMSYATVWINGNLAGGWPYGYASWRVNLTPYIEIDRENQLAIRLDNPPESSRWYPGGGLYRNVWLSKTSPVHVSQWGTFIRSSEVTAESALIELELEIENNSRADTLIEASTDVFETDVQGDPSGKPVAVFDPVTITVNANRKTKTPFSARINRPRLWGPPPDQKPNLYCALTTLRQNNQVMDRYQTRFGIRTLDFNPDKGLFVNNQPVYLRGVNQHHDLGSLGAAFNLRAAERQLEVLREMGCNAIRMSHNPPAPELLDLTDRMGFLVVDEVFDVWERKKTDYDFHLIFADWSEQDLRAMIRRDRNHPSIILWSIGNEVGEQYTGPQGAEVARRLHHIARQEDTSRPTTTAMNYAKPDMPLPEVVDVISLNYQGEGIRNAPAYAGLKGINTPPLYEAFHEAFPQKLIVSSENAAALSSRGVYTFPVDEGISAPIRDNSGGDPSACQVSAYELYTADFGSSADKVFAAQDKYPFVAGGFVWSGWDYLGEPTPYYRARSSYFGIIDLAGFPKGRFYLYQSHWRPELPMVHILPHWNWPKRMGQITPVHVFTSGDEAELFLNDISLGRKKKEKYQYRLRWDDIVYQPGTLKVIAWKNGSEWAQASIQTTGSPASICTIADRDVVQADGCDLSYLSVEVLDQNGLTVPNADNLVYFTIEGPGEIVSTDNGDPTDFTSFGSPSRKAFNGRCLAIIRGFSGQNGTIIVKAMSDSLTGSKIEIQSKSIMDSQ